jgi:hypothetical protein
MSPARSKRKAVPHRRSRAEILKAVGVGVGIVAVTAVLVWLLRPGPAGVPGTGGYMNRQPRSSWLVGMALGVGGIATWWILRRSSSRTRARAKVILPITLGVVLVATIVSGVFWPGGLLRHDVAPAPEPPTTTTPSTTAATATTVAQTTVASTTAAAGSATTTAPAAPSTTGSP